MIIFNNFKKISLLLIIVILYGGFVEASLPDFVSDKGTVTLTIVNRPPVIKDIQFSPEIAFGDTTLECIPILNDENPSEVKLIYRWYVNNELVETNGNYLIGFKGNDLVRCEATPIDNENVFGETKSASILINKKPVLSAITSFVIKNYNTNLLSIFNSLF